MHLDTVDITDDFVSYISATFVLTCMHHANYLRLSQSHLNVDQISWSPIQVTKHPKNYKWKCMLDIFQTYFDWFFWCFEGENYWTHFCSWFGRSLFWTTSWGSRVKLAISQILTLYWGGTEDLTICWFAGTTSIRSRKTEQLSNSHLYLYNLFGCCWKWWLWRVKRSSSLAVPFQEFC